MRTFADVREMSLDDVDLHCLFLDRLDVARRQAAKGPSEEVELP